MKFKFIGLVCWFFLAPFVDSSQAQCTVATNITDTSLLQAINSSANDKTCLPLVLSSHSADVNLSLWQNVVELGTSAREAYDFPRAHYYFAAAQQIARLLSDQRLEGLSQRGVRVENMWALAYLTE